MIDYPTYFQSVYSNFQQVENEGADACDRFLSFAGKWTVRLRFANASRVSRFTRAFNHLATEPMSHPDLTICVFDSTNGTQHPPYPPTDHRGIVWQLTLLNHQEIKGAFQLFPNRLTMLNLAENIGVYWADDLDHLPWYEECSPLKNMLHWWLSSKGYQAAHAAAVGTEHGGVLLVGKGGAGKSTTSLSCVNHGFSYVSDDFCLIGRNEGQLYAHSLFNTAKLDTFASTLSLPKFEAHICNPDRPATEKGFLYLQEHFPESVVQSLPIQAIVMPIVTGTSTARITAVDPKRAIHTLVQSTMICLLERNPDDFYSLIRLTRNIPCYTLELGTDLNQIPGMIREVLDRSRISS